jgi:hypothetical protein
VRQRDLAGALCWLVTTALFIAANVATAAAWRSPYSLLSNNVSDLGNVSCAQSPPDDPPSRYICSPLHGLFDVSVVAVAALVVAGVVLTWRAWGTGIAAGFGRILILIAAVGYATAGLRPADVDLNLHVLGAFLIMGAGNLALVAAALVKRTSAFAPIRVLSGVLAVVALAASYAHFSHQYLGLGTGGTERIAIFSLETWLVVASVLIVMMRKRQRAELFVCRR